MGAAVIWGEGYFIEHCIESVSVMHDSDSGIGIDSGISPIFAGIGTGIGITDFKRYWNRNRNRNQRMWSWNRNRNQEF